MGLFNQFIRELNQRLKDSVSWFNKHVLKKKPRRLKSAPPRSWKQSSSSREDAAPAVINHRLRLRIPGFLFFKRVLAGFLLLVNFVFSQFLLGNVGSGAQPLFIVFLLNAFIIADYLWKTRKKDQEKKAE